MFSWIQSVAVMFACAVAMVVGVAMMVAWLRGNAPQIGRRSGIYVFRDGKRVRYADPITVLRAIRCHPTFRLDIDLRKARDGSEAGLQAVREVVCQAFGVVPFSDGARHGLTEMEMVALLSDFIVYCDEQKKNSQRSATPADFLDAMSEACESETTQPTLDSGLTSTIAEPATPST
jgi:hypothetical protein